MPKQQSFPHSPNFTLVTAFQVDIENPDDAQCLGSS